ncbi:MAG TPA: response regulator [Pseudomonadota bacterium]|nr:response regulator [Pseudomonadota bacterium]
MSAEDRPTVLLVDDDEAFRERLARALRDRGYEVRTADGYDAALQLARADSPEYAVVDLRMPGRSGLEVVRDLAALDSSTRIVILTGYGSIATAVDAVRLGAVQYLPKPADADDLVAAFQRADLPPLAPLEPLVPPATAATGYSAPSLARAEYEHIQRVLRDCRGNISEAARRLGLPRRSLQRKLGKNPPVQ